MRSISIFTSGVLIAAVASACGGSNNGDDTGAPDATTMTADAYVPPAGVPTAFRISDLDLREPHVFLNLGGCSDVTDMPLLGVSVNVGLQKAIQTDANSDGLLDFNALVVFRPFDASKASGPSELRFADCVSPMTSTSCKAQPSAQLIPSTAANQETGTCLGPLPGTTFDAYTPEVSAPSGPCFASDLMTLQLKLGSLGNLTLRDAKIAATYTGTPTSGLAGGLIQGFLSETDANAIILPAPVNAPLSSVLPGGTGSCATHDDRDVNAGIRGWYFYLDFKGSQVPYTD